MKKTISQKIGNITLLLLLILASLDNLNNKLFSEPYTSSYYNISKTTDITRIFKKDKIEQKTAEKISDAPNPKEVAQQMLMTNSRNNSLSMGNKNLNLKKKSIEGVNSGTPWNQMFRWDPRISSTLGGCNAISFSLNNIVPNFSMKKYISNTRSMQSLLSNLTSAFQSTKSTMDYSGIMHSTGVDFKMYLGDKSWITSAQTFDKFLSRGMQSKALAFSIKGDIQNMGIPSKGDREVDLTLFVIDNKNEGRVYLPTVAVDFNISDFFYIQPRVGLTLNSSKNSEPRFLIILIGGITRVLLVMQISIDVYSGNVETNMNISILAFNTNPNRRPEILQYGLHQIVSLMDKEQRKISDIYEFGDEIERSIQKGDFEESNRLIYSLQKAIQKTYKSGEINLKNKTVWNMTPMQQHKKAIDVAIDLAKMHNFHDTHVINTQLANLEEFKIARNGCLDAAKQIQNSEDSTPTREKEEFEMQLSMVKAIKDNFTAYSNAKCPKAWANALGGQMDCQYNEMILDIRRLYPRVESMQVDTHRHLNYVQALMSAKESTKQTAIQLLDKVSEDEKKIDYQIFLEGYRDVKNGYLTKKSYKLIQGLIFKDIDEKKLKVYAEKYSASGLTLSIDRLPESLDDKFRILPCVNEEWLNEVNNNSSLGKKHHPNTIDVINDPMKTLMEAQKIRDIIFNPQEEEEKAEKEEEEEKQDSEMLNVQQQIELLGFFNEIASNKIKILIPEKQKKIIENFKVFLSELFLSKEKNILEREKIENFYIILTFIENFFNFARKSFEVIQPLIEKHQYITLNGIFMINKIIHEKKLTSTFRLYSNSLSNVPINSNSLSNVPINQPMEPLNIFKEKEKQADVFIKHHSETLEVAESEEIDYIIDFTNQIQESEIIRTDGINKQSINILQSLSNAIISIDTVEEEKKAVDKDKKEEEKKTISLTLDKDSTINLLLLNHHIGQDPVPEHFVINMDDKQAEEIKKVLTDKPYDDYRDKESSSNINLKDFTDLQKVLSNMYPYINKATASFKDLNNEDDNQDDNRKTVESALLDDIKKFTISHSLEFSQLLYTEGKIINCITDMIAKNANNSVNMVECRKSIPISSKLLMSLKVVIDQIWETAREATNNTNLRRTFFEDTVALTFLARTINIESTDKEIEHVIKAQEAYINKYKNSYDTRMKKYIDNNLLSIKDNKFQEQWHEMFTAWRNDIAENNPSNYEKEEKENINNLRKAFEHIEYDDHHISHDDDGGDDDGGDDDDNDGNDGHENVIDLLENVKFYENWKKYANPNHSDANNTFTFESFNNMYPFLYFQETLLGANNESRYDSQINEYMDEIKNFTQNFNKTVEEVKTGIEEIEKEREQLKNTVPAKTSNIRNQIEEYYKEKTNLTTQLTKRNEIYQKISALWGQINPLRLKIIEKNTELNRPDISPIDEQHIQREITALEAKKDDKEQEIRKEIADQETMNQEIKDKNTIVEKLEREISTAINTIYQEANTVLSSIQEKINNIKTSSSIIQNRMKKINQEYEAIKPLIRKLQALNGSSKNPISQDIAQLFGDAKGSHGILIPQEIQNQHKSLEDISKNWYAYELLRPCTEEFYKINNIFEKVRAYHRDPGACGVELSNKIEIEPINNTLQTVDLDFDKTKTEINNIIETLGKFALEKQKLWDQPAANIIHERKEYEKQKIDAILEQHPDNENFIKAIKALTEKEWEQNKETITNLLKDWDGEKLTLELLGWLSQKNSFFDTLWQATNCDVLHNFTAESLHNTENYLIKMTQSITNTPYDIEDPEAPKAPDEPAAINLIDMTSMIKLLSRKSSNEMQEWYTMLTDNAAPATSTDFINLSWRNYSHWQYLMNGLEKHSNKTEFWKQYHDTHEKLLEVLIARWSNCSDASIPLDIGKGTIPKSYDTWLFDLSDNLEGTLSMTIGSAKGFSAMAYFDISENNKVSLYDQAIAYTPDMINYRSYILWYILMNSGLDKKLTEASGVKKAISFDKHSELFATSEEQRKARENIIYPTAVLQKEIKVMGDKSRISEIIAADKDKDILKKLHYSSLVLNIDKKSMIFSNTSNAKDGTDVTDVEKIHRWDLKPTNSLFSYGTLSQRIDKAVSILFYSLEKDQMDKEDGIKTEVDIKKKANNDGEDDGEDDAEDDKSSTKKVKKRSWQEKLQRFIAENPTIFGTVNDFLKSKVIYLDRITCPVFATFVSSNPKVHININEEHGLLLYLYDLKQEDGIKKLKYLLRQHEKELNELESQLNLDRYVSNYIVQEYNNRDDLANIFKDMDRWEKIKQFYELAEYINDDNKILASLGIPKDVLEAFKIFYNKTRDYVESYTSDAESPIQKLLRIYKNDIEYKTRFIFRNININQIMAKHNIGTQPQRQDIKDKISNLNEDMKKLDTHIANTTNKASVARAKDWIKRINAAAESLINEISLYFGDKMEQNKKIGNKLDSKELESTYDLLTYKHTEASPVGFDTTLSYLINAMKSAFIDINERLTFPKVREREARQDSRIKNNIYFNQRTMAKFILVEGIWAASWTQSVCADIMREKVNNTKIQKAAQSLFVQSIDQGHVLNQFKKPKDLHKDIRDANKDYWHDLTHKQQYMSEVSKGFKLLGEKIFIFQEEKKQKPSKLIKDQFKLTDPDTSPKYAERLVRGELEYNTSNKDESILEAELKNFSTKHMNKDNLDTMNKIIKYYDNLQQYDEAAMTEKYEALDKLMLTEFTQKTNFFMKFMEYNSSKNISMDQDLLKKEFNKVISFLKVVSARGDPRFFVHFVADLSIEYGLGALNSIINSLKGQEKKAYKKLLKMFEPTIKNWGTGIITKPMCMGYGELLAQLNNYNLYDPDGMLNTYSLEKKELTSFLAAGAKEYMDHIRILNKKEMKIIEKELSDS